MNSNASIICQSHHNQIYKVQHQKGSRSLASKCPQRINGLSAPERDVTCGRERGRYKGDKRSERKRRKKVGNGEGGIDKVEK
jgi:hypothetical protein